MRIISEHSVIGIDKKTKLLACGYKPEHAENHRCRTCKTCVLTKCGCRCGCEVKTSAAEPVTSLASVGTHVPPENASIGQTQGKDHWDQRSLVSSTVQSNWLEQVWLTRDVNSESCKEQVQQGRVLRDRS